MSVCVNVLVAFDVRLAWVAVRSGQRVTVASCEQPTIVDSVAEDASVGVQTLLCWVEMARHQTFLRNGLLSRHFRSTGS